MKARHVSGLRVFQPVAQSRAHLSGILRPFDHEVSSSPDRGANRGELLVRNVFRSGFVSLRGLNEVVTNAGDVCNRVGQLRRRALKWIQPTEQPRSLQQATCRTSWDVRKGFTRRNAEQEHRGRYVGEPSFDDRYTSQVLVQLPGPVEFSVSNDLRPPYVERGNYCENTTNRLCPRASGPAEKTNKPCPATGGDKRKADEQHADDGHAKRGQQGTIARCGWPSPGRWHVCGHRRAAPRLHRVSQAVEFLSNRLGSCRFAHSFAPSRLVLERQV